MWQFYLKFYLWEKGCVIDISTAKNTDISVIFVGISFDLILTSRRYACCRRKLDFMRVSGFFRKYVPVFLAGKMYTEHRNLRGVQKFAETPDVRRNGIGLQTCANNICFFRKN